MAILGLGIFFSEILQVFALFCAMGALEIVNCYYCRKIFPGNPAIIEDSPSLLILCFGSLLNSRLPYGSE